MTQAWIFKSEPDAFSLFDLQKAPKQTTSWQGVRNYQARNFLRDCLQVGDLIFFYHSSCLEPAIVGTARCVKEAYPDSSACDPEHPDFDPRTQTWKTNPWFTVDIQYESTFEKPITLKQLKADSRFDNFTLIRPGNRLSILPVPDLLVPLLSHLERP